MTPGQPWYESAFGPVYVELYAHRDTAEVDSLLEALTERHSWSAPCLDIACGWGRLTRELAVRGLAVGIDRSRALLDRARTYAGQGRFAQSDMRDLPFADESFATAFSLFTSFGYFDTPEEDQRVVREAHRVLHAGGWFVLDFLNANVVTNRLVSRSTRELAGRQVEERRWIDPAGPFLRKEVRVHGSPPFHFEERVRLYPPRDLEALLDASGFTRVESYGSYDGAPFVPEESSRAILVCRARRRG